jgi:hypothetical protein
MRKLLWKSEHTGEGNITPELKKTGFESEFKLTDTIRRKKFVKTTMDLPGISFQLKQ